MVILRAFQALIAKQEHPSALLVQPTSSPPRPMDSHRASKQRWFIRVGLDFTLCLLHRAVLAWLQDIIATTRSLCSLVLVGISPLDLLLLAQLLLQVVSYQEHHHLALSLVQLVILPRQVDNLFAPFALQEKQPSLEAVFAVFVWLVNFQLQALKLVLRVL